MRKKNGAANINNNTGSDIKKINYIDVKINTHNIIIGDNNIILIAFFAKRKLPLFAKNNIIKNKSILQYRSKRYYYN